MQERFEATLNESDVPMTAVQLQDALRKYDAVCPTVSDKISADVLNIDGIRAKILGNYGVGFNHIDLAAAKKQGLVVTNTPEVIVPMHCTGWDSTKRLAEAFKRGFVLNSVGTTYVLG